eukprot:Gb_32062 [translate_table: standard]
MKERKLLRGLSTRKIEVQLLPTSITTIGSSIVSPTTSIVSLSVIILSLVGPSIVTPPDMGFPSSFKIPSLGCVFSPIKPSYTFNAPIPEPYVIPPPTPSSQDAPTNQGEITKASSSTTSTTPSSTAMVASKEREVGMSVIPPFDLSTSIRVSPLISLKLSLWDTPTFGLPIPPPYFTSLITPGTSSTISIPANTLTTLIEYHLSTFLTTSEAVATLGFREIILDLGELAMAFSSGSSDPYSILGESTMNPFSIPHALPQ